MRNTKDATSGSGTGYHSGAPVLNQAVEEQISPQKKKLSRPRNKANNTASTGHTPYAGVTGICYM
jgi:hypothetical protein